MFRFEDRLSSVNLENILKATLAQLMVEGYELPGLVTPRGYHNLNEAIAASKTPSGAQGCYGLKAVASLYSHVELSPGGRYVLEKISAIFNSDARDIDPLDLKDRPNLNEIERRLKKLGSYVYTEVQNATRKAPTSTVTHAVRTALEVLGVSGTRRLVVSFVKVLSPDSIHINYEDKPKFFF